MLQTPSSAERFWTTSRHGSTRRRKPRGRQTANDFIPPCRWSATVNERGLAGPEAADCICAHASDLPILILGATSSTDTQTEKLLQEGIQEMLKNRTSFIIAHRLSTIKNCDRILFIGNKGIMESGSHDELMQKHGHYYQLYTTQIRDEI